MRSIPILAVDATVVFDDISAAKRNPRRNRMHAARPLVLAAYQAYEDAAPEVGGLAEAALAEPQKEALRHAFTMETEPMTTLRGDLLKRIEVDRGILFLRPTGLPDSLQGHVGPRTTHVLQLQSYSTTALPRPANRLHVGPAKRRPTPLA